MLDAGAVEDNTEKEDLDSIGPSGLNAKIKEFRAPASPILGLRGNQDPR